ncbi:hypothetical protein SDC9_199110 [bioreactor metagenome]|uniref:Permease n=1 Tax=bioreactor metagenome TaxID=1076179 RepID=A0A645ISW0_9ZZZZ
MNTFFYLLAGSALVISWFKSPELTKTALKKAWLSFERILPQLLAVFLLIGFILTLLTPAQISQLFGAQSGWLGVLIASVIGSITLIPAFVAFPLAAALLKSGAGYLQITAFISTLMMVGIVTMPMEIKFFGRKTAILRNLLAFCFSILAAVIMGAVL